MHTFVHKKEHPTYRMLFLISKIPLLKRITFS